MDYLTKIDVAMKALIGAATLVGLLFGFFRWVRPAVKAVRRDFVAGRDALVGRDAVHDSITGREIVPALPGIGVRMDTTENQMAQLAAAVVKIADSHVLLEDHEGRIKKLEEAAVERVVARAESVQAWRAIEAVAAQSPHPDAEPDQN